MATFQFMDLTKSSPWTAERTCKIQFMLSYVWFPKLESQIIYLKNTKNNEKQK